MDLRLLKLPLPLEKNNAILFSHINNLNIIRKDNMSLVNLFLTAPTAGDAAGGSLIMLAPLIAIVLIMYFLMIRPQNKKQKETEKMIAALKKGDKVVTIGGIHGVVSSTKEKTVIVKVDDGAKIEFNRSAIATVVLDKPLEAPKTEKKGLFGKKNKKEEKNEESVETGFYSEEKKDE